MTASHSGVNGEPTKDNGIVTEQKECKEDRVEETAFTQVGRVNVEPSSAVLVIGSESLWGGG